ncbi:ATP-grasp domain-containing protein [Bacillus sp. Marseille-P3661]|uniref:ATP-grasp domain-containing protein n=1 Tax=Bacillus sp. Marseille-P3661 TaxID=1936234 RepID=UPI000C866577|nr:ATP-grasp domain-containing protein [Bacillus sp. Marseille-P3661]
MDTIIIIETTKSGSSRDAIKAINRMGYFTVLITERKQFISQRKEFPEVHQMIYVKKVDKETIQEEVKKVLKQGKKVRGIISFVDPFVSLAANLCNEWCQTKISAEQLEIMEDKIKTREYLKDNSSSPFFGVVERSQSLDNLLKMSNITFPFVVKSPVSKASKDVYLVQNEQEFNKAVKAIRNEYPSQEILFEEYLVGPQYLVEVMVIEGNINIVAIVEQEITKKRKFIVTGYSVCLRMEEKLFNSIFCAVESVINDLGVVNAACHLEMRYVNGIWKLIEINPRISGGAMNSMIEEAYGINLVEQTVLHYLGKQVTLEKKFKTFIYTHYITIESYGRLLKVTGKNRASKMAGVREVYIKPRKGAYMTPPISMGHRYGYVMASGESPEIAKENAQEAAKEIKFYLEPVL